MESCVYEGWVRHRRYTPLEHRFGYRLFLMYLDLAEIEQVFRGRWFWSARRPALAWFRRSDYLGDRNQPLDEAVRDCVAEHGRVRPTGPIRLLTNLRYFGYAMNPVSFYYCFADDGARVQSIVAEVTNTPWRERFCYVLDPRGSEDDRAAQLSGSAAASPAENKYALPVGRDCALAAPEALPAVGIPVAKQFHVSPFMPMDVDYTWRFSSPGATLSAHVDSFRQGERFFDATLALERQPLTGRNLARMLLRYPGMTARVVAAIYGQAARLWWKGCPFHAHPRHAAVVEQSSPEPSETAPSPESLHEV